MRNTLDIYVFFVKHAFTYTNVLILKLIEKLESILHMSATFTFTFINEQFP